MPEIKNANTNDMKVFCIRDVRKALARRVKIQSAKSGMKMGELVTAGIILALPMAQGSPEEFSVAFLEAAAALGVADPNAFMLNLKSQNHAGRPTIQARTA